MERRIDQLSEADWDRYAKLYEELKDINRLHGISVVLPDTRPTHRACSLMPTVQDMVLVLQERRSKCQKK